MMIVQWIWDPPYHPETKHLPTWGPTPAPSQPQPRARHLEHLEHLEARCLVVPSQVTWDEWAMVHPSHGKAYNAHATSINDVDHNM
jgi:hypothetical protein